MAKTIRGCRAQWMMLSGCALLAATMGCGSDGAEGLLEAQQEPQVTLDRRGSEESVRSGEKGVLAIISYGNEASTTFLEPKPGVLVIHEKGKIDTPRIQEPGERGLNAVELFEHLSGQPAPASIRAAEERASGLALINAGSETSDQIAMVNSDRAQFSREKNQRADLSWFRNTFCRPVHRYEEWQNEVDPTGWTKKDVNYMDAAVYTVSGNVLHYVQSDDTYVTDWVEAGRYSALLAMSSRRGDKKGSWVQEVNGGDMYDHCINWHY